MNTKYEAKEIITDIAQLTDWSEVIDPIKERPLCEQIICELKATMRANKLEYLTAPQIGYKRRIFCVKFGKNDYRTFINASISNMAAPTLARETCYSLPDKIFMIPRYGMLEIIYHTPLGKVEARKIRGRSSQVINHCIEHLDGVLTSDIGLEIDELFDNASQEEQEEVVKMYLESLDIRNKAMQEEIQNDEELSKMNSAIEFMESVRKGETTLEPIYEEKSEAEE